MLLRRHKSRNIVDETPKVKVQEEKPVKPKKRKTKGES